jgi:hypothetical protein
MKSGSLPGGPWEKLFPRALALIDEISRERTSTSSLSGRCGIYSENQPDGIDGGH